MIATMTPKFDYELKLQDGTVVTWSGPNGEITARNYADNHPGAIVIAFRSPRAEFVPHMIRMVEAQ